jgi:hypothetical protein
MTETQQPAAQPTAPAPKKKTHGCLIVIAAIVAAGIGLSLIPGGSDSSGADQYGAQVMCENFIKDQLKSPGSADFSNETTTMGATDKLWEVAGDVDAENSFGASLRSHFTCVVRYTPSDEYWHLVSLTGLN